MVPLCSPLFPIYLVLEPSTLSEGKEASIRITSTTIVCMRVNFTFILFTLSLQVVIHKTIHSLYFLVITIKVPYFNHNKYTCRSVFLPHYSDLKDRSTHPFGREKQEIELSQQNFLLIERKIYKRSF